MEPEPDSWFYLIHTLVFLFSFPATDVIVGMLAIILLLIGSALVSGSETAFFSLTHHEFEQLETETSVSSKQILLLSKRLDMLLATILISNNFINIAIVILSQVVLTRIIPESTFNAWGNELTTQMGFFSWLSAEAMALLLNFLILTVGVTFLLVLFGEVIPKVYARLNNLQFARLMSGPLTFLMRAFSPLSRRLVQWSVVMEERIEARALQAGLASRQDIDNAIDLTVSGSDKNTEQEVDILKSIIKFGDVSVKQIMTSRVDVVAVDFRISYQELLEVAKSSGFSRIPVYDSDFDNVTGILYVKDLLGYLDQSPDWEWQQLIRTNLLYVPEAKKIDDLLREFQRKHLHLAIVVDEYGGSAGIVTLEDILEEIIGEIKDEFDDEKEVVYRKIDDYSYVFDGKTLLNDFCRIIGIDTETFDQIKGDADSLAGLILEHYGKFPPKDTLLEYNGFQMKVMAVNERRIEQIKITLPK